MNDKRTVSTIDLALQKHDTPVGPLFVAVRHGRIKKCFTRDTAIRYLAFFMTTGAFERSGFPQRHPRVRIDGVKNGTRCMTGSLKRSMHFKPSSLKECIDDCFSLYSGADINRHPFW